MARRSRSRQDTSGPGFKMSVARAIVAEKAPYFGTVLYSMYPVKVDKIRRKVRKGGQLCVEESDTFGVTEKGLLIYTEKALNDWSEDNLVFVLAHETMHIMLEHPSRAATMGYDAALYNIAADIFINDQLRQGNWTDWPATICWPETWGFDSGLLADEYYHLLLQKRAEQQEKKDQRSAEGPDSKPGEVDGEPDLTEMGEALNGDAFGHCGSGAGNPLENEGDLTEEARAAERSPAEMEAIRQQAAEELADHIRRHPGTIPGGLERWAAAKLGPAKVSWREHLRRASRRAVQWVAGAQDYRYGSVHRRQAGFGWGPRSIVMPTMVAPVPTVLLAVDTSGSMGADELGIALREADGLFKSMKCQITVVSCDAEINELVECRNWKEAAKSLKGGGGTSFHPIFEMVDRMNPKPDIVVVATDGGGPAPASAPRGYKVIWLLTGEYSQSPCDWGFHIKVGD
ncbi:MAG: hypothetical protein COA94_06110 [Rickettsiales bacterium]|nr:MAG: hypothetical protein COA94_06110 [Rickettsiales bacterium]